MDVHCGLRHWAFRQEFQNQRRLFLDLPERSETMIYLLIFNSKEFIEHLP